MCMSLFSVSVVCSLVGRRMKCTQADLGHTKPSGDEGGWLGRIHFCYRSGVAAFPADLRGGQRGFQLLSAILGY